MTNRIVLEGVAARFPCTCGCGLMLDSEESASTNGTFHRMLKKMGMLGSREARWRYFQKARGPMFCWTTERIDGKYESFVMKPVGKGSRSGKATEWEVDDSLSSRHTLRKDAKARALKRFNEWKAAQ